MKGMIVDYLIAHAETREGLEAEVRAYLRDGWQPLGGVSVVGHLTEDRHGFTAMNWWYSQAMARRERGVKA